MGDLVVLPVSEATYRELAEQVSLRGQGDRVNGQRKQVNLADVVIECNPHLMRYDNVEPGERK